MSLHTLKREVTERVDKRERMSKLQRVYWNRLDDLFRLINQGSKALGFDKELLDVPPYNGDLFDPERNHFLRDKKVSDFHLVPAIDLLARSVEGNGKKAMIDYSTLDIRHLGSIYEGLLEFRLQIAKEDMVAVKAKGKEKWAKKKDAEGRYIEQAKAGEFYLTTDRQERKLTGSYYTPEYVVKYIVENTLGPVVEQRLKETKGPKSQAILTIKVLDPAMGSGHFLVEAVDFLARHLSEAVERDIETGLLLEGDYSAEWAKREIASHCIYGVDINPMAVELAKVSLWLKTISKDKPLSFLDHRLKCGNSLMGVRLEGLPAYPRVGKTQEVKKERLMKYNAEVRRPFVDELLKKVSELEAGREDTAADIKLKESLFEDLRESKEYRRIKDFADAYASVYFGNDLGKKYYYDLLWALRGDEAEWMEKTRNTRFRKAKEIAGENRFFHWQLEFPEVFYGSDRKENPGFDAVVGNPPYLQKESFGKNERTSIMSRFPENASNVNLATIFMSQSRELTRNAGYHSFIVPKSLLFTKAWEGDRERLLPGLRRLCDVSKAWKDVLLEQCIYVWHNRSESVSEFFVDSCEREKPHPGSEVERELCERLGIIPSEVSPHLLQILNRCLSVSESLRDHANLPCGLPYQSKLEEKGDLPAIGGDQIWRYESLGVKGYFDVDDLEKDLDFIDRVRKPHIVLQRLVAHVLQPSDHIIVAGTVNHEGLIPVNTITCLFLKEDSNLSLNFLCAWLNSRLYSWYAYNFVFSKAIRSMDLYEYYAVRVPLRRISFSTPQSLRATLLEEAKRLCHEYLESEDCQPVLDFVEERLPKDDNGIFIVGKEQSDVVHDFLGHLAESTIEMNRSKNKEIQGFLEWLVREIRTDIETLTGKTKLKEYYRRDFQGISETLNQNRKKLPISPSNRDFQERLKGEFEKSLSVLNPLRKRIEATDRLIDRVVYRLYGLSEDDIELMEESA